MFNLFTQLSEQRQALKCKGVRGSSTSFRSSALFRVQSSDCLGIYAGVAGLEIGV